MSSTFIALLCNFRLNMRLKQKQLLVSFLLYVIVILHKMKNKKKHKRWVNRRWYVRPINKNRRYQGEYNNLFRELKKSKDIRMFFEYSRMRFSHFDQLVQLVKPQVTKKSQRALVPEERLIIALR